MPLGVFYFSLPLLSADSYLSREKPHFPWISSEPVLRPGGREVRHFIQRTGSSILSIHKMMRVRGQRARDACSREDS